MMWSEARECVCGYPVTYHIIDGEPGYPTSRQFVYRALEGSNKGLAETGGYCPKCHGELTLETTHKAGNKDSE